jgi:hypothetical protein
MRFIRGGDVVEVDAVPSNIQQQTIYYLTFNSCEESKIKVMIGQQICLLSKQTTTDGRVPAAKNCHQKITCPKNCHKPPKIVTKKLHAQKIVTTEPPHLKLSKVNPRISIIVY